MLAALIAFQNSSAQPRPSTVKIELRGGGGPRIPMYDIVDYVAAIATFPEVAGEDSIARAARRQRFLEHHLPRIKAIRERRESAMLLTGATLANLAAEERFAAERERIAAEAFESAARELRASRSNSSAVTAAAICGVGAGVILGIALARRAKHTPKRAARTRHR